MYGILTQLGCGGPRIMHKWAFKPISNLEPKLCPVQIFKCQTLKI